MANQHYVVQLRPDQFKYRAALAISNKQPLSLPVISVDPDDELAARRRLRRPAQVRTTNYRFDDVVLICNEPYAITAIFNGPNGHKAWVQIQVGRRDTSFDVIDF